MVRGERGRARKRNDRALRKGSAPRKKQFLLLERGTSAVTSVVYLPNGQIVASAEEPCRYSKIWGTKRDRLSVIRPSDSRMPIPCGSPLMTQLPITG